MTKIRVISLYIDGSGNHPELTSKSGDWRPSNVWRQYQTLINSMNHQETTLRNDVTLSAYYHRGVGAADNDNSQNFIHRTFKQYGEVKGHHEYDLKKCSIIEGTKKPGAKQKLGFYVGLGFKDIVLDCYRHVSKEMAKARACNEEPHIQIVAFSRGAAVATSLTHMLNEFGPARVYMGDYVSESDVNKAFRLYKKSSSKTYSSQKEDFVSEKKLGNATAVDFVGLYDNVPSIGMPNTLPFNGLVNKATGFYNNEISSNVRVARHAIAADEMRKEFNIAAWRTPQPHIDMEQRLFAGAHSNIGGGFEDRGLSDISLSWMLREMQTGIDRILGKQSITVYSDRSVALGLNPTSSGAIKQSHKSFPYSITWKLNKFKRDFNGVAALSFDDSINVKMQSENYSPKGTIPGNIKSKI